MINHLQITTGISTQIEFINSQIEFINPGTLILHLGLRDISKLKKGDYDIIIAGFNRIKKYQINPKVLVDLCDRFQVPISYRSIYIYIKPINIRKYLSPYNIELNYAADSFPLPKSWNPPVIKDQERFVKILIKRLIKINGDVDFQLYEWLGRNDKMRNKK